MCRPGSPFYCMQRWEEGCDDEDEGGGVGGGEGDGGGDGRGGGCTPDDDDDGLHAYVERWGRAHLQWPSELRAAAERPCPSSRQVAATARARRVALRGVYRAAGFVSRTGVRVDHRDPEGGALGVGRLPMEDVSRRFGAE